MIWSNGRISQEAHVPVSDHGLTVGDGVFETIKTIDGQPFALTRHLQRLTNSAVGMRLPTPNDALIRNAVNELLNESSYPVGRLRITWTSGSGGAGSQRSKPIVPTLIITHDPASAWPANARVVTMDWPRNEQSPLVQLKTISYAENVLALDIAHASGGEEAIFFNHAGHLAEGTGSNVLLRSDDIWVTPPLVSGILAGVTRALAVEWCGVVERIVTRDEFLRCDEIVLTSTTRDLQAVGWVNGRAISGTKSDAIQQLITDFQANLIRHGIDP